MLLVETYLDLSPGKGIGLFAKELIVKGAMYWVRNESFDRVFTQDLILTFEKNVIEFIMKYGFKEVSGNWYLCNDHARFTNHSTTPNSKSVYDKYGIVEYNITCNEIKPGEEIFCDYTEICVASKDGIEFPNL